jgi:hypothetical protein
VAREAARAVGDAMPLLVSADLVTVLTIDPREGPDAHGEVPGADIAAHLARHGAKAQVERTVSAGLSVGEVLLSRVADLGADMLVMGAYGHSRARELLLGGATHTVLRSMTGLRALFAPWLFSLLAWPPPMPARLARCGPPYRAWSADVPRSRARSEAGGWPR